MAGKKIAIGADHGGYALKEALKVFLSKRGYRVIDVGTDSADSCDYPEFGYRVACMVSEKKAPQGIVICKSGIGMTIVANKLPGVRAGLCSSSADAVSARQHNDTNVLSLAANKLNTGKARAVVAAWLKTKALKGRHSRRVKKIAEIEKKILGGTSKGEESLPSALFDY